MDDLLERQQNEIDALKSIYANDFADLRNENQTKLNTKTTPANHGNNNFVRITLYPQKSQSQDNRDLYVQIDLKVKITLNYPNELPKLTLENEKGLSTEQIKKLHKQLTTLANNLLGREMIFELCQHVEDFLYQNNKPPPKSFYEQRLESKANFEKEELNHELFDEDKKCDENILAQIDYAVDLKRKMLTEERKKEKEIEKRERLCSTNSPSRQRRESLNLSDTKEKYTTSCVMKSSLVDTTNQMRLKFKPFEIEFTLPLYFKIKCIKLLRHLNENSFSAYLGIDLVSNDLLNVYEWRICLEKNRVFDEKKLEMCESEMSKFEDDFKRLSKLNSRSLIKYLAYKYYREPNKNFFIIQICLEYVEGYTIDFLVNQNKTYTVRDNTIKSFAIQILNTLEYLHVNNIIHKEIKLSSIHIEKRTNVLKMSDYSLVKRLNDLNEVITRDTSFDSIWKASMRSDLHQLGLVLLSLRLGEPVTEFHPKVPSSFPPEIRDFISICITGIDGKQVDCKLLRMHKFIQGTITEYVKKSTPADYDEEEDTESCLSKFNDYPLQSRLNTEFEVIGVLGQGGFGEVLKVKNKLDSRFYAIKRIRINPNSKQYNRQIIREIKLLSRLNHENVVRYYSTWAERYEGVAHPAEDKRKASLSQENPPDPKNIIRIRKITENNDPESSSEESDEDYNGNNFWSRKDNSPNGNNFNQNSISTSDLSSHSSSKNSISSSATTSDEDESIEKPKLSPKKPQFHLNHDETDDSVVFAESSNEETNNNKEANSKKQIKIKNNKLSEESEDSDDELSNEKQSNNPIDRQFIYIQMEYCGGKTLKYLIDNNLYKQEERVWFLLREILQGLNHIHEQGMIHRDLKPGNILIDQHGHAKIGDFGLATSKFIIHKTEHTNNDSTLTNLGGSTSFQANQSNTNLNKDSGKLASFQTNDSHHSITLSGAVGTAMYVAPEVAKPSSKNKFVYTQKVDIYSLGIVFYEMCFPFNTKMERILVLSNLREKEIIINNNLNLLEIVDYEKKIHLVKLMLNHDPSERPSTKELLSNEIIPRKADEIALDELLKTSFSNKQSTNYKKILSAMFEQNNSKADEVSYDKENCKLPNSFNYLQIRENVYNTFTKIFQKYGGYLITYPLLMPWNDVCNDFNKAFKLVDLSGTVVTLPFNHRIPFARYLARSGCNNLKRYYIGNVYQINLKEIKDHPKERIEASFDIVTSSHADCLPEIEILSIVNEIINSFPELANYNYKLICNHTHLLKAILIYCSIDPKYFKPIFYLLSEYTNKLIKSQDASKEIRYNFLKDKLRALELNENVIEKLLNFLLKQGEPDRILSEMRSLTKSESHFSKLAREGLNQLKLIVNNSSIIDFKIPIVVSTSFVLPIITHPYEYSGFVFQLLIEKKKEKKLEYHILASCGRYDKLISYFKMKDNATQCAIGVSFDFQKILSIINEQAKQKFSRPELVICSIGNSTSLVPYENDANSKQKQQSIELSATNNNSLMHHDIRNRLRLYKQFMLLNKNMNTSTHLAHEKFANTDEADEYCRKYCISSYVFLKESSSLQTSQVFLSNSLSSASMITFDQSTNETINSSSNNTSNSSNQNFLRIRSLIDKGLKFIEKKFNLQEFLMNSNTIINNMSSFNSLNSSSVQSNGFQFINQNYSTPTSGFSSMPSSTAISNFGSTSSLSSCAQSTNNIANNTYIDYLTSMISNVLSTNSLSYSASPVPINSTINTNTSTNSSTNSSNVMSMLNITILTEPYNKQQSSGNTNRKKLESQIVSKISHVFSLFSSRTRIEVIAIETHDNVLQCLANYLHLEMDEPYFNSNWAQFLEKLNNIRFKKQLCNFRLDELIHDLRYVKKSKVFVFYSIRSDQFKLIVAP